MYYKSGYAGIRPAQIEVMPPGLRMVAGNALAAGPQEHMKLELLQQREAEPHDPDLCRRRQRHHEHRLPAVLERRARLGRPHVTPGLPVRRSLPGGYSVHGDWFNGWKPDIMQTWTRLCVQQPATTCGSHMLGDGRVMA